MNLDIFDNMPAEQLKRYIAFFAVALQSGGCILVHQGGRSV